MEGGGQGPQKQRGPGSASGGLGRGAGFIGGFYRYFIKDGVRYHHILDPATGFPARLCAGTTVVMESATLADILSTAIFIKGPQTGLDLAESIPEVDGAMVLLEDGSMYGTPGMTSFIPEE